MSPRWSPSLADERRWCPRDLIGADPKPVGHVGAAFKQHGVATRQEFHPRTTESNAKRRNNALNLKKCCSNMEVWFSLFFYFDGTAKSDSPVLCSLTLTRAFCRSKLWRNSSDPRATSAARVVARALGDQGPAGEAVLQKSALLQVTMSSK